MMTLNNVKSSLGTISRSLENQHGDREYLITNTREIVILCSQAIIDIHKNDLKSARKKAQRANELLIKYRKKTKDGLTRYLVVPEQELVELLAFLSIVENKNIPSVKSLGVSGESYILGLLDCIGELKRLVFDSIRVGKSEEATRIFKIMESLYLNLYPFAIYDKIVREVRRKLDVNRSLIEDTRTAITEEIRRSEFIKKIDELKK